jgi:hypothetical protein
MNQRPGQPAYPEPLEWVDAPDPVTQGAIDEAYADITAGRTVICVSDEAFDALLELLSRR